MKDLCYRLDLALDAARFAIEILGLALDEVQTAILDVTITYGLLNCCRQYGKTFTLAVKAVHQLVFRPGSTVLVLAPTKRQAAELLRRVYEFLRKLGIAAKSDGMCRPSLVLPNGSRILGLPANPETVRGYSPQLVIVDEAAYCPNELEAALRPMMMNTRTRRSIWLASTPNGRRGSFYELWMQQTDPRWRKFSRRADECAWINQEALQYERERLGEAKFAQEYLCQFLDNERALLRAEVIARAFDATLIPLEEDRRWFLGTETPVRSYVGLDLGQQRDRAALAVVEYLPRQTFKMNYVTYEREREMEARVRYVRRFALGTDYLEVVRETVKLLRHSVFVPGATLVVDSTGVGAAVVDLLRQALRGSGLRVELAPVVITGGYQVTAGKNGGYQVPKFELMDALRHVMEGGQVKVASRAGQMERLRKELEGMERRVRETGGVEISGKRSGGDDVVMALALAMWRMLVGHRGRLNRETLGRLA